MNPNIEFTMEMMKTGTLPFLDISIYRNIDGTLEFTDGHRVYRKVTHTNLYLNKQNHHHHYHPPKTVLSTLIHGANLNFDNRVCPKNFST